MEICKVLMVRGTTIFWCFDPCRVIDDPYCPWLILYLSSKTKVKTTSHSLILKHNSSRHHILPSIRNPQLLNLPRDYHIIDSESHQPRPVRFLDNDLDPYSPNRGVLARYHIYPLSTFHRHRLSMSPGEFTVEIISFNDDVASSSWLVRCYGEGAKPEIAFCGKGYV